MIGAAQVLLPAPTEKISQRRVTASTVRDLPIPDTLAIALDPAPPPAPAPARLDPLILPEDNGEKVILNVGLTGPGIRPAVLPRMGIAPRVRIGVTIL